jgi:hypothetical protein
MESRLSWEAEVVGLSAGLAAKGGREGAGGWVLGWKSGYRGVTCGGKKATGEGQRVGRDGVCTICLLATVLAYPDSVRLTPFSAESEPTLQHALRMNRKRETEVGSQLRKF